MRVCVKCVVAAAGYGTVRYGGAAAHRNLAPRARSMRTERQRGRGDFQTGGNLDSMISPMDWPDFVLSCLSRAWVPGMRRMRKFLRPMAGRPELGRGPPQWVQLRPFEESFFVTWKRIAGIRVSCQRRCRCPNNRCRQACHCVLDNVPRLVFGSVGISAYSVGPKFFSFSFLNPQNLPAVC